MALNLSNVMASLSGSSTASGDQLSAGAPPRPMRSVAEQTLAHMHDVMLNSFAEKEHINNTAIALGAGLSADYSRPFPGSSTTINATQQPGIADKLLPWLMGLLTAGALGGAALHMLKPQTQAGASPSPRPSPTQNGGARVRVWWGDTEIKPGQTEIGTATDNDVRDDSP